MDIRTAIEQRQNEKTLIALGTVAVYVIVLALYIIAIVLLCKGVKNQVARQNAGRIAVYVVMSLILCWPAAIGQIIYVALKWSDPVEREKRRITNEICDQVNEIAKELNYKNNEFDKEYYAAKKAAHKDDYERWKEQRLKEQAQQNSEEESHE